MWKVLLIDLGMMIFKLIPLERIVAALLNKMIDKINNKEDLRKATTTCTHLMESVNVLSAILADAKVTPEEVKIAQDNLNSVRKLLIETWAKGESASKELEIAAGVIKT